MRGQNAFVFNLNMIIHIFLHLSNAFSAGPAAGQGACRLLEAPSRRLRPFRPPDPCRNLVLLPKNGRRQGGKTPHSAKFWEPEPLRPPGSLVPPAAGPPCRQGSPKEPLRATAGKVRRSAKNASQGRSFPFLSTLPARGATVVRFPARCGDGISIHAPREGSDYQNATAEDVGSGISIHAPREGSDGKIQQTSKMDFTQKPQMETLNTQNRMQFCVSNIILT